MPILREYTSGEVGEWTFEQLNYVHRMLMRYEHLFPKLEDEYFRTKIQHEREFDAIILNSQLFAPNRWEYAWAEGVWSTLAVKWVVKDGGMTSSLGGSGFSLPAYNSWESHNDGTGQEGLGATVGVVGGSERFMLPIMAGTAVRLRAHGGAPIAAGGEPISTERAAPLAASGTVSTVFTFRAPNAFDVVCASAGGRRR